MNHCLKFVSGLFVFSLFLVNALFAQPWVFVRESEGIKIYTRHEKNSSIKAFKGEAVFHSPVGKVFSLLANEKDFSWWDKDATYIKVLAYEENKFIRYYFIYHLSWPLRDRDIAVDSRITIDPRTGERIIMSRPLPGIVPEKPGLIRINKYWQKWTVRPIDKSNVTVILEGFIDPGGNLPSWLTNVTIPETPLRILRSLRAAL